MRIRPNHLQERGEQLEWLKLKNEAQPIFDTIEGEDGSIDKVAHITNGFFDTVR
jgi:hypothetical protein